jgi:hypothetical protein
MKRISWPLFSLLIIVLGFMGWVTDGITPNGERTAYTAACQDGNWQGTNCTGTLVAGDRFRFRALKAHREVLFWTVGSTTEPTGRFSDCEIQDGRNWNCKPSADFPRTITREMVHGCPVKDSTGQARSFHQVSKGRWFLLKFGVPTGNEVRSK